MDLSGRKILIVDDESGLRESLKFYLEDRGCVVYEAANGIDGIEKFRNKKPDAAVIDLKMPGMGGSDVIKVLHREFPFNPLVVLSGTGVIEQAMIAIRNGAWDYISKPVVDMSVLEHSLKTVFEKASLLSEKRKHQNQLEFLVRERTKELGDLNEKLHRVVETTTSLQGFDRIESFGKFLLKEFVSLLNASGGLFYISKRDRFELIHSIGVTKEVKYVPFPPDENSILNCALSADFPVTFDLSEKKGDSLNLKGEGSVIVFPLTDNNKNNVGVVTLFREDKLPFPDQDKEIGSILSSFSSEAVRAINFIQDMKKREQYFRILAKGIGGSSDKEFYESIVRSCVSMFETEYALLGRIEDGKVHSVAYIENGKFSEISIDINKCPASKIIETGSFIYSENFREDERDYFPDQKDIKSYIGVAIKDNSGLVTGILSTFSRYNIGFPDYWREILEIMAYKYSSVRDLIEADFEHQRLKENLRQAQKMEALGTLAGGIAHDFNNILSPILGYSDMLLLSMSEEKVRKDLTQIKNAGLRAKDLVMQILSFSRQKEVKAKPFDIQIIVREVMKMLKSTLPATIKISQKIDKDCHPVYADPTQIHQVIMNLCTNAFHAMEENGGVLTVSSENTEIFEPYHGYRNYVVVKVRDTGTGIDSGLVERIFEPYFTTKKEGKGTGLGLSVAHGIVTSCGGFIDVETKKGKGTAFSVYLPVVDAYQKENDQEENNIIQSGSERLMVVDDQIPILKVLENLLGSLGYRITCFESSIEALRAFKESPGDYDMVITDQTMPDMTGEKLVKKIFEIDRSFPVILCTGYSSVITKEKALSMGIRAFMSKPIEINELASAIRNIFDS